MRSSIPAALIASTLLFTPLAAAAGGGGSTPEQLQKATRLVARGDRALGAGNLPKAGESYRKALRIVPDLPEGHVGLGHVQMRQRQFAVAHESFTRARKCYLEIGKQLFDLRNERYSEAQAARDNVRIRMRSLESSIENSRSVFTALSDRSSSAAQSEAQRAKLRLRIQQMELNRLRQQLQRLERIKAPSVDIESIPEEIHFFIGNALLNLGRIDEAIEAWETCARNSTGFPLVHNNLAVGYWKQGRFRDALESLRRAENLGFEVNPDFKSELRRSMERRSASAGGLD